MTAGNKSAAAKRPVGENGLKISRKRLKSKAAYLQDQVQEPEKPRTVEPDQVFRFMDLPGELRNRIYEMAAEWCTRCFPHTWPKNKKKRKFQGLRTENQDEEIVYPQPKPLPYIGLTQVCSVIRTEFRPLWLSTHRFPLYVLDDYFKAFFPTLLAKTANKDLRQRVEKYHSPAGTLRLWISPETRSDIDILKVLKFKVRFPDYTFTPVSSHPSITDGSIAALSALLNNTNPKWIKWIRGHIIKQVHVTTGAALGYHIVIKERYAPACMKASLHRSVHGEIDLADSLGLKVEYLGLQRSFGVDYS